MHKLKAVSYTHLDVYKRQVPVSIISNWEWSRNIYGYSLERQSNVILSHFSPASGLWALACSTYFTRPNPFLYVVPKMKPIESLPYFVKGFVNRKMASRCTIMHLLQNRMHFTSGNYQLHDHVSSICTYPSPFQQFVF